MFNALQLLTLMTLVKSRIRPITEMAIVPRPNWYSPLQYLFIDIFNFTFEK